MVEKLKRIYQQLAGDIRFSNLQIIEYINRKCNMGLPLKRGDKIYLLQKHIKIKRLSIKLDFKKLGLFKITEKVSLVNFRL